MNTNRLVALALALLVGCKASLSVQELDPKRADTVIDGVPFRMTAPHHIHLYEWSDDKESFVHLSTHSLDFADTDKLFTVDFSADSLADPTFELAIAEDGTIQKVTLDSKLKVDEALGGAVAGANEVKDALLAAEKRAQELLDRQKADEKARMDDATAQENARLAAYEAFLKAETAAAEYDELSRKPDATPAQKLAKLNEVFALRAKANTLYKLAGMTPPYELELPQ